MRFVTPVTLAFALVVTGGVAVAPAIAKDKKAEAPAGGPNPKNLSDAFKAAIVKAQEAEKKKDVEGQKAGIAAAEPLAKTPDELYFLNAQKLNLSMATNDAALQGAAVNAMLDTGLVTDPRQVGQFNAVAAEGAYNAKNYDLAIQRAKAAIAAGYKPESMNVVLAQAYFGKAGSAAPTQEPGRTLTQQGLASLKAAIDATKAAGQPVPAQWYQIGVSRAYAAKLPELGDWARLAYEAQPNGENLRTMIRLFQQANPTMTNKENLDVLRLMSASGGLTVAVDYLEYAEVASKTGIFGEVKSAIDAGRAKGVLKATQGADLLNVVAPQIASDKASLASSEGAAQKAADGKLAAATANAYLGYGEYAKAASLFATALQKGGVDADETNTRLGIAKAQSGDVAGAKAAFEAVKGGVRKGVAALWLSYLATKGA